MEKNSNMPLMASKFILTLSCSKTKKMLEELPVTTKDLQFSPFRLQTNILDKIYNNKKKNHNYQ